MKMKTEANPEKYETTIRAFLQKTTDTDLVYSFNSQVENQECDKYGSIYLPEYLCEFERRSWDYSVIKNSSGGFNLANVFLKEKKLYFVNEYLLEVVDEGVVIGEIILRTRLWITVRILFPFIGWENNIGIPNQALGTTRHFWTNEGDKYVREYGSKLLIESYKTLNIIDENIDIFVEIYDSLKKELKEIDKLQESETKEKIKWSLWNGFHNNLYITYGLGISIYDKNQLEQIILAYKTDKRKIYFN